MIQINSQINLLGIELVHLEIIGIQRQINEDASVVIHHPKVHTSVIQHKTTCLDVVGQQFGQNLDAISFIRFTLKYERHLFVFLSFEALN
jgi:hypothetical protein